MLLLWIVVLGMPPHCSHVNYDVKKKKPPNLRIFSVVVVVSTPQGLVEHAQNRRILISLDLGIFSVNIERFPNRQDRM